MKTKRTRITHRPVEKFTAKSLLLSAFMLGCLLITGPLHATEVDRLVDYDINEIRSQYNEERYIESADYENGIIEERQVMAANTAEYDYDRTEVEE